MYMEVVPPNTVPRVVLGQNPIKFILPSDVLRVAVRFTNAVIRKYKTSTCYLSMVILPYAPYDYYFFFFLCWEKFFFVVVY